jgi:hypothetical protein
MISILRLLQRRYYTFQIQGGIMTNQSITTNKRFQNEDGMIYTEVILQEYTGNNCIFSAGFVEGGDKPKEDIIYIRLEKDGIEPTVLLLRPDEAQILAWIASGVVWSHLMNLKND